MRRVGTRLIVGLALAVAAVLLPGSAIADPGVPGIGTESRQWVDGATPPPASMSPRQYSVTVVPTVIPTRRGDDLLATLFLPDLPEGQEPGPCVLMANGYSPPAYTAMFELIGGIRGTETEDEGIADLAKRGYAVVHVWMRATDDPDDKALYHRYREDGYDAVEWMAKRPWCNEKVGMVGASLHGISQWVTAKGAPPSLKAIVPKVGCGDCYWYLWYPGGMLPGPGREARRYPLTPYDEFGAAIRHRNYDRWWRKRNSETPDHRAMAGKVAVLNVGGWDDYIYAGGVRATEELVAAGGHGMQILGPWNHVEAATGSDLLPYSVHTYTVLWFDRFLKGIDNGVDDHGGLIYVEGADQYRFEDEWPIDDAHETRLYLRKEPSGSATSLNDGSLSGAPSDEPHAAARYRYDPDGPYNDAGGGSVRPTRDQRVDEEHSLTWTTEALTKPTEITGWPKLTFWASSSARDTDFVVEITDVAPNGTSTQVGRGWLKAPRYFSRSDPRPLEPGRIYRFKLEVWPISHVFRPGHRIRVSLAGSDHGGGGPQGPFGTAAGLGLNPTPATVKVYEDADHRSHIELPVIGAGWRQLRE